MSSRKRVRREKISALVSERGAISVGALAELLDVSMQTIRRDIEALCEDGGLRRQHGRVEVKGNGLNLPFDERAGTNPAGKSAVGDAAARLIHDGASLFLSIGSTPLSVAKALRQHKELTVITNNLSAAMALSDEVSNRIILPGGELRLPDRDILGDDVLDFFGQYRAEFAVFGVAGVAEDGGMLDFHAAEMRVREEMRRNARQSVLVLDSTKFGRLAPAAGGNIAEVDHVVLDRLPATMPEALMKQIEGRLSIAEGEMA